MVSTFARILIALGFLGSFALEAILLRPKPQPGFFISPKGDTVYCLFKNAGSDAVRFRRKEDSIYHPLTIINAKEYNIAKKQLVYQAIVLPQKITPLFLLRIDSGKINLYAFYEHVYKSTHTHLYAIKGSQEISKIFGYDAGTDNKEQLLKLIDDDPKAVTYLNTDRNYLEKTVINAIKIYNGEEIKTRK